MAKSSGIQQVTRFQVNGSDPMRAAWKSPAPKDPLWLPVVAFVVVPPLKATHWVLTRIIKLLGAA